MNVFDKHVETKVDTSNWKEFKVSDLFTQERGKEKAPKQNADGAIPLISETEKNNGFNRNVVPTKVFKGNAITISINCGDVVFYQEQDFCASVNISIIRNPNLNKMNGLFIVAVLKKAFAKYSYNEKLSKDRINDTIIPLPVTSDDSPDWQYMESYMQNLWNKIEITFKKENNNNRIDTSEWKKFKISDLFEVQNGKCGSSNNRDGSIAIINAGTINNGVLGYFDVEPKYENRITIVGQGDGGTGKAFYHNYKFNATSCVRVLIEKFEGMNKYIALFLCTILTKSFFNTGKYNFSNGLGKAKLEAEEILLPVTSDGTPDWQYMEDFMRDIESRSVLIQAIKERAM